MLKGGATWEDRDPAHAEDVVSKYPEPPDFRLYTLSNDYSIAFVVKVVGSTLCLPAKPRINYWVVGTGDGAGALHNSPVFSKASAAASVSSGIVIYLPKGYKLERTTAGDVTGNAPLTVSV